MAHHIFGLKHIFNKKKKQFFFKHGEIVWASHRIGTDIYQNYRRLVWDVINKFIEIRWVISDMGTYDLCFHPSFYILPYAFVVDFRSLLVKQRMPYFVYSSNWNRCRIEYLLVRPSVHWRSKMMGIKEPGFCFCGILQKLPSFGMAPKLRIVDRCAVLIHCL
jgi:hypothetical protein